MQFTRMRANAILLKRAKSDEEKVSNERKRMNTRFSSEMKGTRAYEFRQRERESEMNESTKYKRIL